MSFRWFSYLRICWTCLQGKACKKRTPRPAGTCPARKGHIQADPPRSSGPGHNLYTWFVLLLWRSVQQDTPHIQNPRRKFLGGKLSTYYPYHVHAMWLFQCALLTRLNNEWIWTTLTNLTSVGSRHRLHIKFIDCLGYLGYLGCLGYLGYRQCSFPPTVQNRLHIPSLPL